MAKTLIHYLNTDLDLVSRSDLTGVVEALKARKLFVLCCERTGPRRWSATLERSTSEHRNPDFTIGRMLDAIESLSPDARRIWNACHVREFNIGYDSGEEPWAFQNELSQKTIARLAKCGASVAITIYPPEPEMSKVIRAAHRRKKQRRRNNRT